MEVPRIARQFLAAMLAVAVSAFPTPAGNDALGVVMQATSAHLGYGAASAGTTIYDGDCLSTEENGTLRLRSGSANLYLAGKSRMTLRGETAEEKGSQVELTAGTLVFSVAQAAAMEVRADDALIRPAADAPTLGQITVAGPKKLYVYARRGALKFSYHDESEVIAEGESYRVVLDPPDDGPAAKPDDGHPAPRPSRRRRGFLFFLLAAVAIAPFIGGGPPKIESPDHP
jgi:hypothetical protein